MMEYPVRVLQVGMSPNYGGTESFLMNIYRTIDRSLLQFDFLNVYEEEIACQAEIEAMGGRIFYMRLVRHNGIRQYYRGINAFFKEHSDFQIIHCNCQSLINIDMLTYAKKYKIPVRIIHAHNNGYGKDPDVIGKTLILINKLQLKGIATDYFACSALAGQWMFGNRQVKVINNSIDTQQFIYNPQLRNHVRKELGIDNKLVIGHVGRFDEQKNPLFLLDVFYQITRKKEEAVLLMVGEGRLRPDIEAKIQELGIQEQVILTGFRSDVDRLMQAMDIFVLPSRFEGLGTVLIEAQATGMQCFASADVIPTSAKVTDLLSYLSLQSSAEEWADRILGKPDYERADTSAAIIAAGYDVKDTARNLQNFYLQAVNQNK